MLCPSCRHPFWNETGLEPCAACGYHTDPTVPVETLECGEYTPRRPIVRVLHVTKAGWYRITGFGDAPYWLEPGYHEDTGIDLQSRNREIFESLYVPVQQPPVMVEPEVYRPTAWERLGGPRSSFDAGTLGMSITIDGKDYEVAHSFSPERAIVNYDGLYVLVDRNADGSWALSGEPARDDEKPVLEALTAPMNDQSILNVLKD